MKRFLLVILSILSIALGAFMILLGCVDIAAPTMLALNIIFLALGAFFVTLPILIKMRNAKKNPSPAKSAPPTTATSAKKIEKPIMKGNFISAGGLDIPNGVKCSVSFYEYNIQIDALGQEFSLPHAKIKNVSLSTVKEIQKQYVSSIGGALAGGYLLGPLGALIGGAAKQKTIRNNTKFLIFSYIPNEQNPEMKYIVFEVPASSERRAKDFADAYKVRNKKSKTHIDL